MVFSCWQQALVSVAQGLEADPLSGRVGPTPTNQMADTGSDVACAVAFSATAVSVVSSEPHAT